MTYFYAAASGSDLRSCCGKLQQRCGLAPFRFSEDAEGGSSWEWSDYLECAWSFGAGVRVYVTRGRGRKERPIAWAIPCFPEWANFQLVYQANEPLAELETALDASFEGRSERYADTSAIWTISKKVVVPVRRVQYTGGNFHAIFTLELWPDLDQPGIEFEKRVNFDSADYWSACVETGITDFAFAWLRLGRPISGLRVALTEMDNHSVDMRAWAFTYFTRSAFDEVMEKHAIKL